MRVVGDTLSALYFFIHRRPFCPHFCKCKTLAFVNQLIYIYSLNIPKMQVKYLVLTFCLLFSNLQSRAQVTFTYDPVACGIPTTNVAASVSCGDTTWDAGINADDHYSAAIDIGFTFNFYGIPYTRLVIGANGNVSFNDSLEGTYNPWSIVSSLAGSTIRNSICGPWCDMNFPENGGACTYQKTGIAPNRKFTITYCRVSMYNMPYCAGEWITSQVVLYETSNIVEVRIAHKTVCNAWNNGRAICGLINASGSSSTIAPSRDWAANWGATDEAWRFTPVGTTGYSVASAPYSSSLCGTSLYWYDSLSGAYLGAGPFINIPTNVPRHLKAAVFSNCRDTAFYYLTVPVPTVYPNPKEILGPDTFCVGSTVSYTDSTHGGTWYLPGMLTGTVNPTGINVTGISDGIGMINYILPTGCKAMKAVIVNPLPDSIMPIPITICRGHTDSCSSGTSGGIWSSGNTGIATINPTSGVVTAVATGTTFITYTVLGCSAIAPITVNPQPAAILPADTVLCRGRTATFSNSFAGGSWSSSNAAVIIIGSASGTASAVAPGTATITYSLPEGCYSTANVTVNASPGSITPPAAAVCMNATLVLSNTDLGGSWSSGNTGVATVGFGSGIVTPVSPGTVAISYTFPNGCYSTAAVSVNPSPTAITPLSPTVCIGNSTTLSSMPTGGTWSVDNPAILHIDAVSGVVTGISTGGAVVTYALSADCYVTTAVLVNAPPAEITPAPANACIGNTMVLSNAALGGTWSSSNPAVATIGIGSGIVTTVSTGTAVITYTLPGLCYKTAVITVNPMPAAITPAITTLCAGNTAVLSNASGTGTWSSANTSVATIGSTSGIITGVAAGTAYISYILPSGCYEVVQVTVNNAPAAITPAHSAVCQGDLLFLSCATTGGTWSSGNPAVATVAAGSGIVSGIVPGTAIISYILPGVCYSTDTVTVKALPAPISPANMNICQGGVDTFFSSPAGGLWSSNNTIVASIGSTGIVTGNSAGTTTISYSLATGCYRTAQIFVEPASPIVPAEAMICTGRPVTFTNTGTGGTWSISDPSIASLSTGAFTVSATGDAPGTATLTYSFPGGCYRIASITVNTSPAEIMGKFGICAHDTTTLADTSSGGHWSSSASTYATVSASGLVTGFASGTATISYTIPNGCYATAIVTVFALPNAGVITGADSICIGNNIIKLTNTPGTPGYWQSDNTAILTIDSATGIISGWAAGTVIVTYKTLTDANGCADYVTFPVHVLTTAPFTIEETINAAKCYGDDDGSIFVSILNGSGAYTYTWQNGPTVPLLTSLQPGSYSVTVTDTKTNCTTGKGITLTQPDSLDMAAEVSPDICSEGVGAIKLAVTGGTVPYKYIWSNDSAGSEIQGLHAGNYEVTVADYNGCNKRYTIPLRDSSGRIHIHNALSPNGDGFNDVWLIDLIEDNPHNEVQILNKWGNVIWEKRGYNNDWDGVGMSGDKLPDGTYYYIVRLNNPDPRCAESMYKGALLIKR